MAIYDFICSCGHKEAKMMLMKNRNKKQKCPFCGSKMDRLIGNPGLAFKGTGFYTTDVLHPKTLRKQVLKEKKHRQENSE